MATEIRVPTLGESVTEATVGQWFKKVGDVVKADELSRWLPRRPLYATLRSTPVMIPVDVHHVQLSERAA